MKKYVVKYITRCTKCQQVKVKHQNPTILLNPLSILEWKWEVVTMDFIIKLPNASIQHGFIMVVVENLSKLDHFIPIKSTHKNDDIARIFMREVFILHGLPKVIVFDMDTKFISNFWKSVLNTCVPR